MIRAGSYNVILTIATMGLFLQQTSASIAADMPFFGEYYGSGGEQSTLDPEISGKVCGLEVCASPYKQSCCDHMRCCSLHEYTLSRLKYEGITTECRFEWPLYLTGVKCPPDYDHERIHCCERGRSCCTTEQLKREAQGGRRDENQGASDSGVGSIGAIAGLVFLAVIILGTALTVITRYVKIKVRREHAQAGINSEAYITAMNQRNNPSNSNNIAHEVNQRPIRGLFYAERPPTAVEGPSDDEDNIPPPPSYAEAVATCPVLMEASSAVIAPEEIHRDQQLTIGNSYARYTPFARPPTRPSRRTQTNLEAIELGPSAFKNVLTQSEPQRVVETRDNTTITLPKPEDSSA